VLLTEPWRLRAGVNAARATIPIGELHQAQLVVASDDAFTELRAAARGTLNLLETDVSLVAAWRGEDGLVGLDVRGTRGVGFWLEAALHLGDALAEELAVGIDYSFPVLERLVLTAQYYRNGRTATGDLLARLARPEPFAPVFSGRDYLMASAMLGVAPELSAATLWVLDLANGSALSVSTVNLLVGGRWEVALSVQQPIAGRRELPAALLGLLPVTTVTAWARFSF